MGNKQEISPFSLTTCQPHKPLTQLIQTRWPRACTLPLQSWQLSFQYPSNGCLSCGTDRKRNSRQTCKTWQTGSADTEPCHLQRGQDTSPLSVQWRLEKRQQWIPSTPWPNLETGAGPADRYLPPAPKALWSECPSEEDWHFRHFHVWMRTSWTNPRRRPSVLPKVCLEKSANMATWCWSSDQAVGLGRRPLPDGSFCSINRTEDLTCTAVNHWRRRTSSRIQILIFKAIQVSVLNKTLPFATLTRLISWLIYMEKYLSLVTSVDHIKTECKLPWTHLCWPEYLLFWVEIIAKSKLFPILFKALNMVPHVLRSIHLGPFRVIVFLWYSHFILKYNTAHSQMKRCTHAGTNLSILSAHPTTIWFKAWHYELDVTLIINGLV